MSAQIYHLTSSGLKPIDLSGVMIGQRVIQAHRSESGVVYAQTASGFSVVFDDGSESHSQTVGALSPFTRITPVEPVEIVPEEWLAESLRMRDEYRAEQKRQTEEKASQHAADTARLTAELREKYPWAVSGEGLSGHARAAKNLKAELSRAFPGVKFSVKSESFSGGDSVNVRWTLGPTTKQVEEIASKYKDSDFDGMTDSTVYDHSAYGAAVDAVLGRVMFASCYREDTPEVMEQIERGLCALQQVEYAGPETIVMDSGYAYRDQVRGQARELVSQTAFPVGFSGALTVESNEDREDYSGHWAKIVFPAQLAPEIKPEAAPLSANGVTVTENEEKNGVEIKFAAKPGEEVRDALKRNGFRWSKFQSLWYAKRNPQTLAFARSLATPLTDEQIIRAENTYNNELATEFERTLQQKSYREAMTTAW